VQRNIFETTRREISRDDETTVFFIFFCLLFRAEKESNMCEWLFRSHISYSSRRRFRNIFDIKLHDEKLTTCFYDIVACIIYIIYYYNTYLNKYIFIYFFSGPGIPFLRRVQALNLAWIIVGETYDVASSHAFRTKLLDQRQAPDSGDGGSAAGTSG
jgi:hypothetical protein